MNYAVLNHSLDYISEKTGLAVQSIRDKITNILAPKRVPPQNKRISRNGDVDDNERQEYEGQVAALRESLQIMSQEKEEVRAHV